MKRAVHEAILTSVLAWALFELYIALTPDDLTERFYAFLETAHGRFESFYAERRRRSGQAGTGEAPLGE